MIVYKTTNLINGKIYIGQDSKNNPRYFGSGLTIKKAVKKYGVKNFVKEILEYCDTKEQLSERETYWIEYFDSTNKKIGYNISKGGEFSRLGTICSGETKLVLSECKKGSKNPMYGKTIFEVWVEKYGFSDAEILYSKWRDSLSNAALGHIPWNKNKQMSENFKQNMSKIVKGIRHTDVTKQKISEGNKGKIITVEHRNAISKAQLNRTKESRLHTKETKLKLSNSKLGDKNPMKGKSVFDVWVEKYGFDEANTRQQQASKKRSESLKKKKVLIND